jgi:hypothetical protein
MKTNRKQRQQEHHHRTTTTSSSSSSSSSASSSSSSSVLLSTSRSLFDWQFLLGGVRRARCIGDFSRSSSAQRTACHGVVRQHGARLRRLLLALPAHRHRHHRRLRRRAPQKISDSEFELRATGRQLVQGRHCPRLARSPLRSRLRLPLSSVLASTPVQSTFSSRLDRFVKYEFGFVRATHEADLRARFPALPPTLSSPARAPRASPPSFCRSATATRPCSSSRSSPPTSFTSSSRAAWTASPTSTSPTAIRRPITSRRFVVPRHARRPRRAAQGGVGGAADRRHGHHQRRLARRQRRRRAPRQSRAQHGTAGR